MTDGAFAFSTDRFQAKPAPLQSASMKSIPIGPAPVRPLPAETRQRLRVVLYSHDTFGLGHLRRNLAIAEALLAPGRTCDVLLLSGSPVLGSWPLPAGLRVQPLPPVVKLGAEKYAPRGGTQPFSLVKGYREALILQTVLRERPDVVLIDHAPSGMKHELLSMLATVRRDMPNTRLVLGLRDIIDSPDAVRRLWESDDIYDLLEHAYDQILVYGSRELFDVAEAYRLPASIEAKLRYVGYVGRPAAAPVDLPWPQLNVARGVRVLVTVGGGGDGFAVMSAYLTALSALPEHTTASLLIAGPLMSPEQTEALTRAVAQRRDAALAPATHDLPALIARAELVVTMGGYNTTTEILAARKLAIVVPRSAPRVEQLLRARMLERLGVVHVAEDGPDLARSLAGMMSEIITGRRGLEACWEAIDLDGARRTATALEELVPVKQPARRTAYFMKRYPRLSETFILNEICAMEALGEELEIFSLLQPEPLPHHPMVMRVRASLAHLPASFGRKLVALARAHSAALAAAPTGYARALALAARQSVSTPSPLSSWRQFLRAGFFATKSRRRGVTHLHAHFANAPAEVAELVSCMTGLPFSFTAHAKDLYLTRAALIAKRTGAAQFVATCTQYNVDYLRGILPGDQHRKVNLVYHGIDLTRFHYRSPTYAFARAGTPPLILCVARLVPKKGLDDLIAACELLRASGVAFRCRIVGGGPLRADLEADIAGRGLEGFVVLEGAMIHDRLIDLFGRADLFALAPRITDDGDRDGIPNVILEAMATGVPVVSSAISGIPELVEDERTGLLAPPNDAAALALAMARLLSDPKLGQRLAAAARARLEQSFDCWCNTGALRGLMARRVCEAVEPPAPLASAVAASVG